MPHWGGVLGALDAVAVAPPLQEPELSSTPGPVNPHNGALIEILATKAGTELSWLTICAIVTQHIM